MDGFRFNDHHCNLLLLTFEGGVVAYFSRLKYVYFAAFLFFWSILFL